MVHMDKVAVNWLNNESQSIAQVYSSGLEYCLLSEDFRQCHDFVYCKDFLQDAVQAFLNNREAEIYGFEYNPITDPPVYLKKTRIALANKSDKDFLSRVPNTLDFVNQFAKKLHLKKTKAFEANPPKTYKQVVVMDGSQRWLNSPPLLSVYTLFLRCGFAHTIGTDFMDTINGIIDGKVKCYGREDATQLRGALEGIKKILSLGYRAFFYIDDSKNYPSGVDIDSMHNDGGIVGFSSGYSLDICRYWHRKSLAKRLEAKQ